MLLEPLTHRWIVPHTAFPFNGYLPFTISLKVDDESSRSPATSYCQKILQSLGWAYRQSLQRIKFVFHLDDPLELCYKKAADFNFKFNIVHCSPLMAEQFGLANDINATGQILSKEPESILITESSNWSTLSPTVIKYAEESLCAPLSMLPTMYGVRLADPSNPSRLIWRRVPI